MQTFFFLLVEPDFSPRALMLAGAISLGLLTVFLRHKLG
jgi:hypothetical protein